MSSTRRTEIPARYISISASSTELSRRRSRLDDGRLEGLAPKLRNLEVYFAATVSSDRS